MKGLKVLDLYSKGGFVNVVLFIFKEVKGLVEVSFGVEHLLCFYHECLDFHSHVCNLWNHLFICCDTCHDTSFEGITSLGIVIVNIHKERRKDLNESFANSIKHLMEFGLEALFPVYDGVSLTLEGKKAGGGIASWLWV
jgi:hypothetical protein